MNVPPTLNNVLATGSPDNSEVTPTMIGPMTGIFLRAFLDYRSLTKIFNDEYLLPTS